MVSVATDNDLPWRQLVRVLLLDKPRKQLAPALRMVSGCVARRRRSWPMFRSATKVDGTFLVRRQRHRLGRPPASKTKNPLHCRMRRKTRRKHQVVVLHQQHRLPAVAVRASAASCRSEGLSAPPATPASLRRHRQHHDSSANPRDHPPASLVSPNDPQKGTKGQKIFQNKKRPIRNRWVHAGYVNGPHIITN